MADYLSKTVTEESQIETAISGVEGLLKAFQGDIDTVRNEKSGLQKQLDELKIKSRILIPILTQIQSRKIRKMTWRPSLQMR